MEGRGVKRKRAEESQEQRENRLAAQREINKKKIVPRNHTSNAKTGLRLKKKLPKESVPRNHKSNVKTGLRLKEKLPKKIN